MIDIKKTKEKNSLYWNNHHTLIEDLSCPLHEVQRAWIRKPISILFVIVLFIPAIVLAFVIATIEFFYALRIYLRAALDTYKGQKEL